MSLIGMELLREIEKTGRATYAFPPKPLGEIFYVDHFTGIDTRDGQNKDFPLKTITEALDRCVNNHGDVILVKEGWSEATENWPIEVNKTGVHIIGKSCMQGKYAALNPPGPTAAFSVDSLGGGCEIAGFQLGGGDAHGCIELNNPMGLWIHDCWFGNQFHGLGTPQDGIVNTMGGNAANVRIERCRFLGDAFGEGGITRDGIRDVLTGSGVGDIFRNSEIVNNRFSGLITAINLKNPGDAIIEHNYINCGVDQAAPANPAAGINLYGGIGLIIANNKAGRGSGGMTENPYYDDEATTTLNAWLCNQKDNAYTMPAHPQL